MNKTYNILTNLISTIKEKRIQIDSGILHDVLDCVRNEIEVNRAIYSDESYNVICNCYNELTNNLYMSNQQSLLLALETLTLAISLISDSIYELANKDYWWYKHPTLKDDVKMVDMVNYIDRRKRIDLINYSFVGEYNQIPIDVFCDFDGWKYVELNSRRMYFPFDWNEEAIVAYMRNILMEQDYRSPHCYNKEGFEVQKGDVVLDIGAAEGIFALSVIGIAKKIYLVEADELWIQALNKTFRNDDNVEIIKGFVDQTTSEGTIGLDDYFLAKNVNYIKMDIEGYEVPALVGANKIIASANNICCAICTYHKKDDEKNIRKIFDDACMEVVCSEGFMCPNWTREAYIDAEIRRGVVFGKRVGKLSNLK